MITLTLSKIEEPLKATNRKTLRVTEFESTYVTFWGKAGDIIFLTDLIFVPPCIRSNVGVTSTGTNLFDKELRSQKLSVTIL